MRIEALEALARDMVGDGKKPNVFFVSEFSQGQGPGIVLVTTDFETAYHFWRSLPYDIETTLEDRLTGVIASTEPITDGSTTLRTFDDSGWIMRS